MVTLRKQFKQRWIHSHLLSALIICIFFFPDFSSADQQTGNNRSNRLTICISHPIVSFDPTNHRNRETQIVLKNIFDSLTTWGSDFKVVPQLAESWRALDELTWEFKLRRGVRFHNGERFSAHDVKFTLERVFKEGALDGKTSPRKSLLGPISAVDIIDDYTVQIKTEKPWAILPLMLTLQEIVPQNYLTRVGIREFLRQPVGAGPFKFLKMVGKDRLILERFEKYYGGATANTPAQVAPLKHLVFKIVPLKIEKIAMLKKGECDLLYQVPSAMVPVLNLSTGIKVLKNRSTRSYFAEINCLKPPFDNSKIRLALNYAVDMQAVVDHLLQGHGEVLPTVLLPNAFAYNHSLKPHGYKPNLATNLLTAAGFKDGQTIVIKCIEDNREFANLIAAFLAKVGFKSDINVAERTRPKTFGLTADWNLFLTSWGNSTLDPVGILVPKFKSKGRGNFSGYHNEKLDHLFSLAENSLNPKKRADYFHRAQEIIHQDAPVIFGYAAEEFYAVRARVQNFMPNSSGMLNMHDVYVENGD